jgi:Leucine-rich repeat (LRR) protein
MLDRKSFLLFVIITTGFIVPVCFAGSDEVISGSDLLKALRNTDKDSTQQIESNTPKVAGKPRVIHFPKEHSIGRVYMRDRDVPLNWQNSFQNWQGLGEAIGDVQIPPAKSVRLDPYEAAWRRGRAFATLKPDDIQFLTFMYYAQADSSAMKDIGKLTGLEGLALAYADGIETGLEHLYGLTRLKALLLPGHMPTDELEKLTQFPSLEFLNLSGPMVTDAKMVPIGKLVTLTELGIGASEVGQGLTHLKNLKSLRYLGLGSNRNYDIDKHLKHLDQFSYLEVLNLKSTNVGDEGLAHLAGLRKLKKLYLISNPNTGRITDTGMAHLKNINSLQELELPYSGITDVGFAHLANLTSIRKINVPSGVTDKGISIITNMPQLEDLKIISRQVTDKGMEHPARCTSLKKLTLNNCPVTDEGFARLATLKNLENLTIMRTSITGAGLAVLRKLPELRDLSLFFMELGKEGITRLASAKSLERLEFRYLDIGLRDEDLACLSGLTSLKSLNMGVKDPSQSQITNEGLAHLAKLTNLENLRIPGKNINDDGLKHLAKLSSLESLTFNDCPITDRGLRHLEPLTSLKSLVFDNANVTEKGMAMIEAKIPGLQCMARDYEYGPGAKSGRTRLRTSKGIMK